jgi:hypothetical protein
MRKFLKDAINPFSGLGKTKLILGNIGDNLSTTVRLLSRAQPPVSDEACIEQTELRVRYRHARLTAIVLLVMFTWASVSLILTKTTQGFILSSLCSLGVAMYYLSLSKALYQSRLALSNWPEREKLSVTWADYFNAIADNPKNIFPRNTKN